MYKLATSRFGEIEINDNEIFYFENGILAFEEETKFIILNSEQENFYWLQSAEDPDLALPCMDPDVIVENYNVNVDDDTIKSLGINDDSDVLVLCIVRIPENFKDATVNLMAPIIINRTAGKGAQIIPENTPYNVRHRLFI